MSTIAPPPAPAPETPADDTPASAPARHATARALWLRWRWWGLCCLVLLLVGVLIAGIPAKEDHPALDPRSGAARGTRAADQLLQQRGITSGTAATAAELGRALREADTTVVLTRPNELTTRQLAELGSIGRGEHSRLLLLAPNQSALNAFAPGVRADYSAPDLKPPIGPGCDLPEAVAAGRVELDNQSFSGRPGDTACYPGSTLHALLSRTTGTQQVIVLGSADPLTNERLAHEGNAALALGLLGAHPRLVWQVADPHPQQDAPAPATPTTVPTAFPTTGSTGGGSTGGNSGGTTTDGPGDAPVERHGDHRTAQGEPRKKTLLDLVPAGWHWATYQLGLAALLAVAWRARRLGPVLGERLPAVVRASESTEGRARLYHRADARGHAAETLRRATRRRAAAALGLPHTSGDPDPAALTEAAAARLGRPPADLQHLLYGPAPTDDAALLRLADELDDMEWQVRQP
ncbi:DUF4350 domain-containing protein [Kitasatospora sp. NPDC088134]|uniref:DUF4350 domain-containing protein n=1 Tax=Kitasatospora sp. NPDC088134 TaxID=3364071 RepID=UPI00382854F7